MRGELSGSNGTPMGLQGWAICVWFENHWRTSSQFSIDSAKCIHRENPWKCLSLFLLFVQFSCHWSKSLRVRAENSWSSIPTLTWGLQCSATKSILRRITDVHAGANLISLDLSKCNDDFGWAFTICCGQLSNLRYSDHLETVQFSGLIFSSRFDAGVIWRISHLREPCNPTLSVSQLQQLWWNLILYVQEDASTEIRNGNSRTNCCIFVHLQTQGWSTKRDRRAKITPASFS